MRKERKHFTPEEKVAVLRRHLLDKVQISELCEELGLRPTVFYRWQKETVRERSRRFSVAGAPEPPSGGEAETDRVLGEEGADQGRGLGGVDGRAHRAKKKSWGTLTGNWVPHDVRDQVVDFVRHWSERAEISVGRFIHWLGVTASKFYDWRQRYGCVNEHNGWVPRDFWLEPWEKEAIRSSSRGSTSDEGIQRRKKRLDRLRPHD